MSPASGKAPLRGIGPESVDTAGELAPKVQDQNQAHELIKHVAASHPVELTTIQQLEEDAGRSKALDEEEVRGAAVDLVGDEEQKGGLVQVLSARVKGYGRPLDQQWVVVLYSTPSGRNARCAVPYEPMTDSQEAYDQGVSEGKITEGKASDASDTSHFEAQIKRQDATIKRLEAAQDGGQGGDDAAEEKAKLQAELDEALAAKEEAEQKAEDARAGVGEDTPPAPVPDVDLDAVELPDGNADDLIAGMAFYSDDVVAALAKRDERKTVVKAAEAVQKERAAAGDAADGD